jgi:hypothetical protein
LYGFFKNTNSRIQVKIFLVFRKLESNRGNFSKFLIEGSKFTKENPYPKGHTCFNRLELPMYPKFELLETYVMAIAKNSLDGIFGLD